VVCLVDDLMLLCTGIVGMVGGEARLWEYMFLKGEENPHPIYKYFEKNIGPKITRATSPT
jgi:hypothetical protein